MQAGCAPNRMKTWLLKRFDGEGGELSSDARHGCFQWCRITLYPTKNPTTNVRPDENDCHHRASSSFTFSNENAAFKRGFRFKETA